MAEARQRFIHRHKQQCVWPGLWFAGPGLYHNTSKSIDSKIVLPNHGTRSPQHQGSSQGRWHQTLLW